MMGSEEGTNEFNLLHRLEENSIQFGAHQNAYTTFDETCYFLHVLSPPTAAMACA